MAIGSPLWSGMRNGPIRLRLEARAFLGIENDALDMVSYGRKRSKDSKRCRLKHYLAAHRHCQTAHPPPARMLNVVNELMAAKTSRRPSCECHGECLAAGGN